MSREILPVYGVSTTHPSRKESGTGLSLRVRQMHAKDQKNCTDSGSGRIFEIMVMNERKILHVLLKETLTVVKNSFKMLVTYPRLKIC